MKKIVEILFIISACAVLMLSVADVILAVLAVGFIPLSPIAVIIFAIDATATAISLAASAFFITNKILRISFFINLISAALVISSAIIIFCFI